MAGRLGNARKFEVVNARRIDRDRLEPFPWSTYLASLMGFAIFVVCDPFGLASATSATSRQLIERALSLLVAPNQLGDVAVVLVDDASVPHINGEQGYPITFSQHAGVLRPIMCARPAAVFIDITFRGIRSNAEPAPENGVDAELAELMAVLSGKDPTTREYCRGLGFTEPVGTPDPVVLLARTRSHPPDRCDPLFGMALPPDCVAGRQIDQLTTVAKPVSVAGVGLERTYAVAVRGGADADGPFEPSPALEALRAFCRDPRHDGQAGCRDLPILLQRVDASDGAPRVSLPLADLAPMWPFFQADTSRNDQDRFGRAGEGRCRPEQTAPTISNAIMLTAVEVWHTAVSLGERRSSDDRVFGTNACLPLDTLTALDVRSMVTACDQCAQRLAAFFAGRMVFYGVDITGINDTVYSSVLGYVPGVMFHAVAAQNLANSGANYPRALALLTDRPIPIGYGHLIDIIGFAAAAFVAMALSSPQPGKFAATIEAAAWTSACASLAVAAYSGLPPEKVAIATVVLAFWLAVMLSRMAPPRSRLADDISAAFSRISVALVVMAAYVLIVAGVWESSANIVATLLVALAVPERDRSRDLPLTENPELQ